MISLFAKGLTVDVRDAAPASGLVPFSIRRTAPGVFRSFDFDSLAQLGGGYGQDFGCLPGVSNGTLPQLRPVLDASVKASGVSSLRMDTIQGYGSDCSGAWYTNFSIDRTLQFGANSEFFVQWRQRYSQAFCDTVFMGSLPGQPQFIQGGIKQAILTAGDQNGPPIVIFNSNERIGLVSQTYFQNRFADIYAEENYAGLWETVAGGDRLFQNKMPGCDYNATQSPAYHNTAIAPPGCAGWHPNEWMTYQIGVTIGPLDSVTRTWQNSRVRKWIAREGQPSTLVIDWNPAVRGYFPLFAGPATQNMRFGKLWLLPYMTYKDSTQQHPPCSTWYDEVILSTQQIADAA